MILIGLAGRRGSGKDTAFQSIQAWAEGRGLSAVRRGFADKLKHSAALALGFVVEEQDAVILMDSLKEIGEITTCIPNQSVLYTISGRKFLQLYGTEAHRDVFGPDFWVDALLPLGDHETFPRSPLWHDNFAYHPWTDADGMKAADFAVVTDVRFENEAQRIKDLGGHVWEIIRPGGAEDDHSSEVPLPRHLVDQQIYNDGTIEQFRTNVNSEMTIEFHMRFLAPQMEEDDAPDSQ